MLRLHMSIYVTRARADVQRYAQHIWSTVNKLFPNGLACALLTAPAMICIYKALDVTDNSIILTSELILFQSTLVGQFEGFKFLRSC